LFSAVSLCRDCTAALRIVARTSVTLNCVKFVGSGGGKRHRAICPRRGQPPRHPDRKRPTVPGRTDRPKGGGAAPHSAEYPVTSPAVDADPFRQCSTRGATARAGARPLLRRHLQPGGRAAPVIGRPCRFSYRAVGGSGHDLAE